MALIALALYSTAAPAVVIASQPVPPPLDPQAQGEFDDICKRGGGCVYATRRDLEALAEAYFKLGKKKAEASCSSLL